MRIVGKEKIDSASRKHAEWSSSLRRWVRIAEGACWKNFALVRQTFSSASRVGVHVIFNIAGNKARLVTVIDYEDQLVAVESVLTHAEYVRKDFTK